MEICRSKTALRACRDRLGRDGARIGLVPTMGYLHQGHLSLVARAMADCERVVATIFVNPTQFGPGEDFDSYPRDHERDLALLREAGVHAVFLPDPGEMYAPGATTTVAPGELGDILIGTVRPGHFTGVATVVTKLINLVQPHAAFFGQKDYQQLAVIRALASDLDMPVRIVGVPTSREADGLAMSSRNVGLTPEHRAAAPGIHAALRAGAERLSAGTEAAETAVRDALGAVRGAEIVSIDLRDAETLQPARSRPGRPIVILVAARFGHVLLIDNIVVPESP